MVLLQASWLLRFMDHMDDLKADSVTGPHLDHLTQFLSSTDFEPGNYSIKEYHIM